MKPSKKGGFRVSGGFRQSARKAYCHKGFRRFRGGFPDSFIRKAVLPACKSLIHRGFRVSGFPAPKGGRLSPETYPPSGLSWPLMGAGLKTFGGEVGEWDMRNPARTLDKWLRFQPFTKLIVNATVFTNHIAG